MSSLVSEKQTLRKRLTNFNSDKSYGICDNSSTFFSSKGGANKVISLKQDLFMYCKEKQILLLTPVLFIGKKLGMVGKKSIERQIKQVVFLFQNITYIFNCIFPVPSVSLQTCMPHNHNFIVPASNKTTSNRLNYSKNIVIQF